MVCSVLLASFPTTQIHAQAAQVVKAVSKMFGKKAAKEVAEETAEQVAKEAAQSVAKKAGQEIVEETAEQAIKRLSKEAAENVIKKNASNALFRSSRDITKNLIYEVAPSAIRKALITQLGKELGETALKTTSKEFAQQIGYTASKEAGEQFIKRLGTEGSQEALERSAKSSIKSLKDEAFEQTNKLKKQVQKPLTNKISKAQQKALKQLSTITDDINKFKKSTNVNSKAETLLDIKRKLDNAPDCAEKQKILNNLPDDLKAALNKLKKKNGKYKRLPSRGSWAGEAGNSTYKFDPNQVPRSDGYNNTRNLSMRDIIEENNLHRGIDYKNGHPDLSRYAKGSVDVDYGKHHKNLLKGNRQSLHEEAFEKMAKEMGITIDELKVIKGDADAAQRLAKKWGCSVDDVFKRCGNPNRRQYVLHEDPNCKTLRLIPREIHANLPHDGGIEMYKIIAGMN